MRIIKTTDAFAKLNLTLDITGKKDNGYHTLESFMQTISLKDKVTVEVFKDKPFSISLRTVPDFSVDCHKEKNLCYKAAEKFCENFNITNGEINITLEKNIPIKAGLGGGSSNCAAVLRLLSEIFSVNDDEKLAKTAASLGSDVPFFLKGGLQKISGIGNITEPVKEKINAFFVIVKPDKGLSAKEVYEKFDTLPFIKTDFSKKAKDTDFSLLSFKNGLEKAAFLLCEVCRKIKDELILSGADNAFLCGSGAAVAGVFKDENTALGVISRLKDKYYFTLLCRPIYFD